jgi:hypothetical protein
MKPINEIPEYKGVADPLTQIQAELAAEAINQQIKESRDGNNDAAKISCR